MLYLAGAVPAHSVDRSPNCADGVRLTDPRTGKVLLEVDLAASGGAFALTYVHSVNGSLVRSHYIAGPMGIRQTGETFAWPGYGMGAVPASDGTVPAVRRDDNGQTVMLDRLFPTIVLRLQRDQENRLEAARPIALAERLGDRAVELSPACLSMSGTG